MLCDPERSLVEAWLESGHRVTRVAFGVSGESFYVRRRRQGLFANVLKYVGRHIDDEALAAIARGELTCAQARVGVAWRMLCEQGPMCAKELDRALGVKLAGRPVIDELLRLGAAEIVAGARFIKVRAIGERAPEWRRYLPASDRRAA